MSSQSPSSAPDVAGYRVRRLAPADAGEWAEFAVLPKMQEFTSTPVSSAADLLAMIERSLAPEPNAPYLFAARDLATNALVATFGFHTVSSLNRTAELTYQVHPQHWGRGLATAVGKAAVEWAFRERRWVNLPLPAAPHD